HDLALVADMADEVIVMYRGQIVEQGDAKEILQSPKHPYTKALLACRPGAGSKGKRLPVISDFIERDNIDKNLGGDNTGNGEKMNIADSNAYAATQDVVGDNTNNGGDKSMVKDNTNNGGLVVILLIVTPMLLHRMLLVITPTTAAIKVWLRITPAMAKK
ncbi:hypothetical protein EGI32_17810, partial [Ferruginibacter sp. HRS2-29]|nr:hypothetical protein [Ferruginibacter sp. HRS2-29]